MLYSKLVSDIFAEGCLIEWEVGKVRCLYVPHTGKRYRVTYNGNKDEFYLDAYKKFENKVIRSKF